MQGSGTQAGVIDNIRTRATATMRAAVICEPGVVRIEEVAIPAPGARQVRVRLEGCGVSQSNLIFWEGRPWVNYPMQPGMSGHEAWGRIDALGEEVTGFAIGQRVTLISNHGFAQYDIADKDAIATLPNSLCGSPFPGEPLGRAINIFRRSGIFAGQTVAIVGIGFVGALLTRLASVKGARVIAISRRQFSLDIARAMGAAEVVSMNDNRRAIEHVRTLTNEALCDVTIEAVGMQQPLNLAAELTREHGRLIVAGYHQDEPRQVDLQPGIQRSLDVINAHECDQRTSVDAMREAARAIEDGLIDPSPIYTHTFPLNRLSDALNITRTRPNGFAKALITM